MKTSKIIYKVENYFLHDFNFHIALYDCLRECASKERILLLTNKCNIINNKYSDINFSPNEISCLLSGLMFSSSSYFINSDFSKHHLGEVEITSKNTSFNEIGRKFGCHGRIFMSLKQSFLSHNDKLLNKQLEFLTIEEKKYFFDGRNSIDLNLSATTEQTLFWLAGKTSRHKDILTLFNKVFAFEVLV